MFQNPYLYEVAPIDRHPLHVGEGLCCLHGIQGVEEVLDSLLLEALGALAAHARLLPHFADCLGHQALNGEVSLS